MTVERALLAKSGQAGSASVYIEDVFSSWLRTGTGASTTITNNVDISTNGGLVITKSRSAATGWRFTDKTRGATYSLDSSSTASQATDTNGLTAYTTSGYTIGSDTNYNNSGATYVDFAFRKQAKFFDIVTYTGTGTARTIAHSLGATPGMIIVKRTDTTGNWQVYHNGLTSAANSIQLNLTAAQASATTVWNSTAPTSSVFSVGTDATVNASGGTYVAYLFAASNSGGFGPAGTDSVVACGSFSGKGQVNLGWEPQFIIIKPYTQAFGWMQFDNMRGLDMGGGNALRPNVSDVEDGTGPSATYIYPNATGFDNQQFSSTYPCIYLAIRRGPMKTPTDATKVFAPSAVNVSAATKVTTNFPIDWQINYYRGFGANYNGINYTRLTGVSSNNTDSARALWTTKTDAEGAFAGTLGWDNTGFKQTNNLWANTDNIYWNFRRAPGFFDVVCYTGTGSATTVAHNLGVAPELMIVKRRDALNNWVVYNAFSGNTQYTRLNTTIASTNGDGEWNTTTPTASVFSLGALPSVNASSGTYVAYLFATCPGVSKVGSYTGTGAAQNIDCGFAAGARFVLIKRTDSTGAWYTYDSARGINASGSNDPYLLLNSTAAEVTTTDYLGTYSSGFALTSSAPADLNASGGTYIYLAIA